MSIADVMRLHARLRPDKLAIVEGDRQFTYRSLNRRIDGFCHRFRDLGMARGGRVAVALGDTAAHLIALLGLARLGALIVPMDHRWSNAELAAVASSFGTRRMLVDADRPGGADIWLRAQAAWFAEESRPYRDPEVGPESPLILSLSSGTTGIPKRPCASHQQYENRFMAYWIDLGFNAYDRFVSATPLYFGGGRRFS